MLLFNLFTWLAKQGPSCSQVSFSGTYFCNLLSKKGTCFLDLVDVLAHEPPVDQVDQEDF